MSPVSLLGLCPNDQYDGDQDGECHDHCVSLSALSSCPWSLQTGLLLSSYPHYLIITIMGEVGVDRVISRASKMDIAIELWF